MSADNHSTKELIVLGTAAFALGASAGLVLSQRETQTQFRRVKRKIASVFASLGLNGVADRLAGSTVSNGM